MMWARNRGDWADLSTLDYGPMVVAPNRTGKALVRSEGGWCQRVGLGYPPDILRNIRYSDIKIESFVDTHG